MTYPFLSFSSRSKRSGSALLIILGCVALLTILITAFLLNAGTEFSTSNFYAKGVSTKLLSENVINLVMAQLREGARSTDVNTSLPVAWATQPGMIRTYDNSGNPYKYFKLYSWDNMDGSGAFDESQSAEMPPNDWSSTPNIFTDLNEPIKGVYPILDPAAQGSVEGFSLNLPGNFTTASNLLPMPVKWLYVLKDGTLTIGTATGTGTAVHVTNATTANPVIGRVAFWTDDETCKVNINTASEGTFWDTPIGQSSEELGVPGAIVPPYGYALSIPGQFEFQRIPGHPATTSLSPVFGFGTNLVLPDTGLDNESLNWPLTTDTYASDFAPYYTLTPRYTPGGSMGGAQQAPPTFTTPSYRLYDSIDELVFDPSRTPVTSGNGSLYPASSGASPTGRTALAITPSVLEQKQFFITAHSRAPEETLFGTPRVSLWPLQADINARTAKDNLLAFCTTINNQPYYFQRAQWYQYQKDATTASETNSNPPSSQSQTTDFPDAPNSTPVVPGVGNVVRNENLYAYLQALTTAPIPGFGGNFLDKYPGGSDGNGNVVTDRDEILTEMFDLLRSGVNTFDVSPHIYPHYTASPWQSIGDNGAQTVTNGGSGSFIPISIPNHTHGLGRTYSVAEVAIVFMASSIDVAPTTAPAGTPDPNYPTYIAASTTGGVVKPATLRRVSIAPGLPWACEVDTPSGPPNSTNPTYYGYSPTGSPIYYYPQGGKLYTFPVTVPPTALPPNTVTIGDPQTTAVQAFLLIRPYSTMVGPPAFAPNIRFRVTNLDEMTVSFPSLGSTNNQSLGFPSVGEAVAVCSLSNIYSSTGESTADGGLNALCLPGTVPNPQVVPSTSLPWNNDGTSLTNYNYPFVGKSVPLPTNSSSNLPSPAYPSPFGGEDPAPDTTFEVQTTGYNAPPLAVQIHNAVMPGTDLNLPITQLSEYPGATMVVNGATPGGVFLKIDVLDGVNQTDPGATPNVLSTVYVNIPQMTLPVPTMEMANGILYAGTESYACGPKFNNNSGPRIPAYGGNPIGTPLVPSPYQATSTQTTNGNPTSTFGPLSYYFQMPYTESPANGTAFDLNPLDIQSRFSSFSSTINRGDVVRSFEVNPNSKVAGDMRILAANPIQSASTSTGSLTTDLFTPLGSARSSTSLYGDLPTQGPWTSPFIKQLHTMITNFGNGRTEMNLVQTSGQILAGDPTAHILATPIGSDGTGPTSNGSQRVSLGMASGGQGMLESNGSLILETQNTGSLPAHEHYPSESSPEVTPELMGAFMDPGSNQIPGDWTLGPGPDGDGPYISKPDEGEQVTSSYTYSIPYYSTNLGNADFGYTQISYSPNRQVPSPIIFGTLPTRVFGGLSSGITGGVPWCTLLFCPNPAANDNSKVHPGFGVGSATPGPNDYPPYSTPPDHLFLDLFWMPIVEPYAISEPFSTAGKVNMNYEIVPFGSYIHRSTALHAVMKSTRILAIPTIANDPVNGQGGGYVLPTPTSPAALNGGSWPAVKAIGAQVTSAYGSGFDYSYRYGINLAATIDDVDSAFYQRFKTVKDIFRSASEICNVFLVPQTVPGRTYNPNATAVPTDASYADMTAWWKNFQLTGDNGRESPYNQIYPRLTTKSDTFEVHMRVQVLSQTNVDRATGTVDTTGGDSIIGEYRGSAIIERYVDPSQTNPPLPDFATTFPSDATSTLDNYVHYRVVSTQAFAP